MEKKNKWMGGKKMSEKKKKNMKMNHLLFLLLVSHFLPCALSQCETICSTVSNARIYLHIMKKKKKKIVNSFHMRRAEGERASAN